MPEVDDAIDAVRSAVDGKRFRYLSETDLHRGLAHAFTEAGLDAHPEQRVTGGRIDFLIHVGTTVIGVEVKVKGTADALRRQVEGYAADTGIHGFLIVTTKHTHTYAARPANDKPVGIHVIGGLGL